MKKFFAIVCMMLMSTAMFAQAGKTGVGLNVGYGLFKDYKPFEVGAKLQYEFIDDVRAEVSGNYWFPKDDQATLDVMLNLQYLIEIAPGVNVYPMAGAGWVNMMLTGDTKDFAKAVGADTSKGAFGWDVGAGVEYYISSNVKLNLDVKYLYAKKDGWKIDGVPFQIGIVYNF